MKNYLKQSHYLVLLLLLSCLGKTLSAQVCSISDTTCNLVSNGGFEANDLELEIVDYDPETGDPIYGNCNDLHSTGTSFKCGGGYDVDNVFHSCNWTTSGWTYSSWATADYYNACANTCWGTGTNAYSNFTSNGIGTVAPHGGNGYAGIFAYTSATAFYGGSTAYKESVKQTLATPMVAGKTYIIGMWVRLSHISKYAVSDFWINGINFASTPLSNKTAWTYLSTCYTPTSNESIIEIGSNGSTLTDLDPTNAWSYGGGAGQHDRVAYYYIDDVTITPLNVDAGPDVTIYPGCSVKIGTNGGGYSCLPGGASVTYAWSPGTGLSSTTTATTMASPSATTNYTLTATVNYVNPAGVASVCTSTDAVSVSVVTPTVTIVPGYTCNTNSLSSFTANITPSGGSHTYVWTIKDAATGTVVPVAGTGTTTAFPTFSMQTVTQAVNVCVVATNSLGCQTAQVCYYFPNCCASYTNAVKYANTTYASAVAPSGNPIAFGGVITVNSGGLLILTGREVLLEPNTKFVVNGTGRLIVTNAYMHACTAMWDGIYANTTNSVSIVNSRVEDAQRVIIDSLGTASVYITGSYLNKNYMGVMFKAAKSSGSGVTIKNTLFTCSSISTAGTFPYMPTSVNLANAATLGAFSTTNLAPPYNTVKSFCGIYVFLGSHTGKPNSAISLGTVTNEENVFDKMQLGILSYDSKTTIQNNVFQNMKSSIAPTTSFNTGVLIVGPLFGSGLGSYSSIGGSLALKNTFRDNDYGIYNAGKSALLATYNTFSVQTTGVYVTANNNGSTVNVRNNNFYANGIGTNFYNNTFVTASIKDNNFDNSAAAVGTYADNFAVRCTEATLATTGSYPAFDIDNNRTDGYYNGIFAVNTLSLVAYDNEIHMRADNASDHWQAGIFIAGSNDNKINNNTIDMSSLNIWSYWQAGISLGGNQVPKVQCNSINNLHMAIAASGSNLTSSGNGFKGNYMQNAECGVWIVNNGQIGNQAGSTGSNSSDNAWATTCTKYTFSQNTSNPSNHIFYTRSGSGYDLPTAKATHDFTGGNAMSGNNSSAAASGSCNVNASTPSNTRLVQLPSDVLMQDAEIIAADAVKHLQDQSSAARDMNAPLDLANNNANIDAINKRNLLYNILLQNADVRGNDKLTEFMHQIKTSNTGLLLSVDSFIHKAEVDKKYISYVTGLNNAIVANNTIEQAQVQFNNLYLSYLSNDRKVTDAEISELITLAKQCPAFYGNAVYQARTVLFDLKKLSFISPCENVKPSDVKRLDNKTTATNGTVKVYPNPANTQVFVNADGYDQVTVKLYNIMGELVIEGTLQNNVPLDIQTLSNGVYTYKVLGNGKEINLGKLIITH